MQHERRIKEKIDKSHVEHNLTGQQ